MKVSLKKIHFNKKKRCSTRMIDRKVSRVKLSEKHQKSLSYGNLLSPVFEIMHVNQICNTNNSRSLRRRKPQISQKSRSVWEVPIDENDQENSQGVLRITRSCRLTKRNESNKGSARMLSKSNGRKVSQNKKFVTKPKLKSTLRDGDKLPVTSLLKKSTVVARKQVNAPVYNAEKTCEISIHPHSCQITVPNLDSHEASDKESECESDASTTTTPGFITQVHESHRMEKGLRLPEPLCSDGANNSSKSSIDNLDLAPNTNYCNYNPVSNTLITAVSSLPSNTEMHDHQVDMDAVTDEVGHASPHLTRSGTENEEMDEELDLDPLEFIRYLPILPSDITNRPPVLPKKTRKTPDYCLVLDLDETLVHCSLNPLMDAKFIFQNLKDFIGTVNSNGLDGSKSQPVCINCQLSVGMPRNPTANGT